VAEKYTCYAHRLINCSQCRKKVSIYASDAASSQSFDDLFYMTLDSDIPLLADSYTPTPPAESTPSYDNSSSSYDSGSSSSGSDSGSSSF
jgi:hypothetical protein